MEVQQREDEESRTLDLDDSIFKLCLQLFDTLSPTGNQCWSPAGVHQMLSMLFTFSWHIENKRKLAGLLNLPRDCHPSQIYNAWDEYLTNLLPDPLRVSLALFLRQHIRKLVPDSKLAIMKNKYRGDIITFEDSLLAPEIIDKWISRATAGTTRNMNVDLDYVNVLMVSSLNFKGEFKYQHWEIMKHLKFCVDYYIYVRTDFMRTIAYLEYAENSDLRAIKLEYENPDYYLLILLPTKLGRTNQLEKIVTSSTDYLASLKFTRELVDVYIPRFFIQNEMNVLGMLRRIFPDLEDLSIFSAHLLYVNTIRQVNRIDVRERATEDVPFCWENKQESQFVVRNILANEPFVYMLYHGDKILMAGRLCNPVEH